MKILITGNLGYVGAAVTKHLHDVFPKAELIGYDVGYFGHCTTCFDRSPESALHRQYFGDVREISSDILRGIDAVIALAAISNDPMGTRFGAATREINYQSTINLARLAASCGVASFIFASSCSMYGAAGARSKQEGDSLDPLTIYAKSKVDAERDLHDLDAPRMTVTCLRFATACGPSARLRLDLVLNDLVANAIVRNDIRVLSDGTPWRPLIDVRDMARAVEWAITRTPATGSRVLSVNVGRNDANYQIETIARAVATEIPGAQVNINPSATPDNRSYKVDFSLYESLAPHHQPEIDLKESIQGIAGLVRRLELRDEDVRWGSLVRLGTLEEHIAAQRLDEDLRWLPERT